MTDLVCRQCNALIAKTDDIMTMSTEGASVSFRMLQQLPQTPPSSASGPLGTYVNAHGFVHDTITVQRTHRERVVVVGMNDASRAKHNQPIAVYEHEQILTGEPERRDSWFPGYAWSLAYCVQCEAHVGWRFTATDHTLRPTVFWGLRRAVCGIRSCG